jgi:HEAT repeat protein
LKGCQPAFAPWISQKSNIEYQTFAIRHGSRYDRMQIADPCYLPTKPGFLTEDWPMRLVALFLVAATLTLVSTAEPAPQQDPAGKGGKKDPAKGGPGGVGPNQLPPLGGAKGKAKKGGMGPAPIAKNVEKKDDDFEEQVLWGAGLSTEGEALIEYFRARTQPQADLDQLVAVARQLGEADPATRARAAAKLLARGPSAVPALRHVLNELDNPLAAQQARRTLDAIEGQRRTEISIAAAKLLAVRKPAGSTETLLAFLPLADDETVLAAVKAALDKLAKEPGKPDPALLAALHDPLPLRRAIAVEVLAGSGRSELLPEVRKLLADIKPQVRLQAALALAQRLDEQGVAVLIDLLGELPAEGRNQAEKALQQLAGNWSPSPPLAGDDEVSRKIRREAWAAWWRTVDGPALLAAFGQRTLSKDDLAKVEELIVQLGDQSFARRERATTQLLTLGPKVIGLLRAAAKSSDLEQARRAGACLEQILKNEQKEKLPTSAPRLLAVRKPPAACEALLAYLPFNDDVAMKDEICKALKTLAVQDGKPDPAILAALSDSLAMRRAAAAEALVSATGTGLPEVRKLLADADPQVRLGVAMALVYAQDREAVPALIDLVAELPTEQAWEAEELLRRIAGAKAPSAVRSDDAAARQKVRAAWQTWWKENAAAVNLAGLEKGTAVPGLIVVAEFGPNGNFGQAFNGFGGGPVIGPNGQIIMGVPVQQPVAKGALPGNPGNGTDRLIALDRNFKVHWQIENLDYPIEFQILPGNRVLIAEYFGNRVTERDHTGKILWQAPNLPGTPMNVQRLANGNTFIATYGAPKKGGCVLVEVDRASKTVATFNNVGNAPYVRAAYKMADGRMICCVTPNSCVQLDATGKEIKRFQVPLGFLAGFQYFGNIDVSPKGHIIFVQNANTVVEYDPDGKLIWQTNVANANRATRLANGNTLVGVMAGGVIELDQTGKTVWHYQSPAGYQAGRARQEGG